jgi:hypothetical protein
MLDQCLRDGMTQGRRGVRIATDRVMAVCPALTRAQCWQRLRWLREHTCRVRPLPDAWPVDLVEQLRKGYRQGGVHKRTAFRAVRVRYPDLPGHVIVRFARQQGWLGTSTADASPRQSWTAMDQKRFAAMAEHRSVVEIAQALGRSIKAVRWRLGAQSLSARVDGMWSLRRLASTFHVGQATLRHWIAEHAIRVRDAHITGDSLLAYCTNDSCRHACVVRNDTTSFAIQPEQRYSWKDATRLLGGNIKAVRRGVARGMLKLRDTRVSDHALESFCRHHAAGRLHRVLIDPAIHRWLMSEYHLPSADGFRMTRFL